MSKNETESRRKHGNTTFKQIGDISMECEKLICICSNSLHGDKLWENYLELSSTLENIRKLEYNRKDKLSRHDAVEKFMEWLKENGAIFDGVSIHDFPDYELGLRAETNCNDRELILEIPRNLIFNVNVAAEEMKDIMNDPLIYRMPHVALAMALLIEKHKGHSKWKPYLDILPNRIQYRELLHLVIG